MDLLEKNIIVGLKAKNKTEAITELTGLLFQNGYVMDQAILVKDLLEREKIGSTGIGHQIAVPHVRSQAIKKHVMALGISDQGLDFASLDHQPVKLVFLEVCPESEPHLHLKCLARISTFLRDSATRQTLTKAKNSREAVQILDAMEKLPD